MMIIFFLMFVLSY